MQNGPANTPTPAATPTGANPANAGLIAKLQANPDLLRKLLMLAVLVGVGVGAFCWGKRQAVAVDKTNELLDITKSGDKRHVAYLYNKEVVVTREELGEYLIARFGRDRIQFMINRKIVDMECAKVGVHATSAEVEHRFQEDLKSFGQHITEKEFENSILRRFGKTMYEWKEDVIRPKVLMEKLVKATVTITDADIKEGFEAKFGPKVECRMIVCDKGNARVAQQVWENARRGRAHFLEEARKQFIPNLAQAEGRVPPIHKHFGDKTLEDAAFRLKVDEVSSLMEMKDGTWVILLCDKHIPANTLARMEEERAAIRKEMFDLRVAQRIPDEFERMLKRASPYIVLDTTGTPSSTVLSPTSALQSAPSGPPPEPVKVPPAPSTPIKVPGAEGVAPTLPPAPMTLTIPPPMPMSAPPMPEKKEEKKK